MGAPRQNAAYRLRPGLGLFRRDARTWQIGLDPAHAVVVRGADGPTSEGLRALEPGTELGTVPAALPGQLIATLAAHGLLRLAPAAAVRVRDSALRARARADSASAALEGRPDPLPGRRRARVAVDGSGPVAALVATGLAHAGVRTVAVLGPRRPVTPTDLTPAGPHPADVGRPWADAVAALVRALGALTTLVEDRPAQLVVLTQTVDADAPWCDPEHGDRWLRQGTAHLAVSAAGRSGEVSPVVLPGRTACLRCHELHRADGDAGWPVVALALRHRGDAPGAPAALAAPLAAATAALAVARVLAHLDGCPDPAAADSLVVRLPGTSVSTCLRTPHPACGCTMDP